MSITNPIPRARLAATAIGAVLLACALPAAVRADALAGTPPVTTATLSPASPNGQNGWYLGPVTLTLTATDGTSGIDSIQMNAGGGPFLARATAPPPGGGCLPNGPSTYTGPVLLCADGVHTVSFYATDNDGDVESPQTIIVMVDSNPPVTTATLSPAPQNGWYASPTLTLSADDGTGSGVAETDYSVDGGLPHAYTGPVGGFATGNHVVRYFSTDNAGRVESTQSLKFKVDAQSPTVTITAPADGSVIRQDKAVTAKFKCADNQSGLASCTGTVANGAALDTSTVGDHSFTVTATDVAGNVKTVTVHYLVTYTWSGFFAPISNTEDAQLNLVHAGDLIKIGFGLNGNRGTSVFAAGFPTSVAVACPIWAPHMVPAAGAGSAAGLSYGVSSGHYTFGWQTSAAWAGTCRQFQIHLNDGTGVLHSAVFMFFA